MLNENSRKLVTKVIKVKNEDLKWCETKYHPIVSLEINRSGRRHSFDNVGTISMDKLIGSDLTTNQFINVLLHDTDFIMAAYRYMRVSSGSSENFYIKVSKFKDGAVQYQYYTAGLNMNTKACKNDMMRAELFVSKYNKIDLEQINSIWIGYLIEILRKFDGFEDLLFKAMTSSRTDIQKSRRKVMKYIKKIERDQKLNIHYVLNKLNGVNYPEDITIKFLGMEKKERFVKRCGSRFPNSWIITKLEDKED